MDCSRLRIIRSECERYHRQGLFTRTRDLHSIPQIRGHFDTITPEEPCTGSLFVDKVQITQLEVEDPKSLCMIVLHPPGRHTGMAQTSWLGQQLYDGSTIVEQRKGVFQGDWSANRTPQQLLTKVKNIYPVCKAAISGETNFG